MACRITNRPIRKDRRFTDNRCITFQKYCYQYIPLQIGCLVLSEDFYPSCQLLSYRPSVQVTNDRILVVRMSGGILYACQMPLVDMTMRKENSRVFYPYQATILKSFLSLL